MKYLLTFLFVFVAGCAESVPGEAIVTFSQTCLESGGSPEYFNNGASTQLTCKRAPK